MIFDNRTQVYTNILSKTDFDGIRKLDWISWTFRRLSVFIDGLKMDTGTGSSVYISGKFMRFSYRLPNNCSVFQTEILPILRISIIRKQNIEVGQKVTIFVDSQAALKALTRHLIKSRLEYKIKYCCIKDYEVIDQLSREDQTNWSLFMEKSVKLLINHIFRTIK